MDDELAGAAARVAALLVARGETLAVAETSSGGLVSAAFLSITGASRWFLGATVVYSAAAKAAWLGLPPEALAGSGAASEAAAASLAAAVRHVLAATWGLAETGIAGPQAGHRSRKPAGLVYLAVRGPAAISRQLQTGVHERRVNQRAFALAAITLLDEALRQSEDTTRC